MRGESDAVDLLSLDLIKGTGNNFFNIGKVEFLSTDC